MTKARIIHDMPEEEYHSSKELSKSALDKFAIAPKNYWDNYINPDKPEREYKDYFAIGSAVHKAVLEPHLFDLEVAVCPEVNKRTKAGKEEWAEFKQENEGKIIITEADLVNVKGMAESVLNNPCAKHSLDKLKHVESSIFFEYDGVPMRSRLDGITDKGILDLKTTKSASESGFNKSVANYRYHVQAYLYSYAYFEVYGQWPEYFTFVTVEKERPYNVGVYNLNDMYYNIAQSEVDKNIAYFKECKVRDVWPSFNNDRIVDLKAPGWLIPNELKGF
jgi:exodeoxyribonuclease VIII